MSALTRPGQTGEIAGPKKAILFPNPSVAATMIKKAKRPLFVVGSKSVEINTDDGTLLDYVIKISKEIELTVAATAHLIGEFKRKEAKNVYSIPFMNLGDRLRDKNWEGFDGKGPYDLVMFAGAPYYMEWLVLSGLKNFHQELRTMSLGSLYQPNASWSMGTVNHSLYVKNLNEIIEKLKEEN